MKYRYRKQGYSYTWELSSLCDTGDNELWELAARDFYYDRDGFEHHWPIMFEVFDEEGKSLGVREVNFDNEPVFTCNY